MQTLFEVLTWTFKVASNVFSIVDKMLKWTRWCIYYFLWEKFSSFLYSLNMHNGLKWVSILTYGQMTMNKCGLVFVNGKPIIFGEPLKWYMCAYTNKPRLFLSFSLFLKNIFLWKIVSKLFLWTSGYLCRTSEKLESY